MSGFNELERSLTPEMRSTISPEQASRLAEDFYGFGAPHRRKPRLQWSWGPFAEALEHVEGLMFAPFRALRRLMPRG